MCSTYNNLKTNNFLKICTKGQSHEVSLSKTNNISTDERSDYYIYNLRDFSMQLWIAHATIIWRLK